MMEKIVLVGGGGLCLEVIDIVRNNFNYGIKQEIVGILDDNLNPGQTLNGIKVIGKVNIQNDISLKYLISVGEPSLKIKLWEKLNLPIDLFTNVISIHSIRFSQNLIGKGNIIFPFSIISTNVEINNHVLIQPSNIGHDAKIDDFSTISGKCSINGHVNLQKGVFVGSNASINPGVVMEKFSKLGANSHLIKNAKEGKTYYGVPALMIG